MDGRGRLLRSLRPPLLGFAPAALAYAGAWPVPQARSARPEIMPPARLPRQGMRHKILNRLAGPGTGACFSLALLAAVGACGVVVTTNSPTVDLGTGPLSTATPPSSATIGVAALGL